MDSLEEFPMQDSGISEVSSEVSTVSVSEEIKRFQDEITKAGEEKHKFQSWKHQRTGERIRRESMGQICLGSEYSGPPCIPPRGVPITAPTIPSKMKNAPKSVSYAKHEATVLGMLVIETRQTGPGISGDCSAERSRQIEPSSYEAPAEPPGADNTEHDT